MQSGYFGVGFAVTVLVLSTITQKQIAPITGKEHHAVPRVERPASAVKAYAPQPAPAPQPTPSPTTRI